MVTHGIREALVTAGGFPELLTVDQVAALLGVSEHPSRSRLNASA
ncbi:hypothetical protein RA999_20095 [Mycobacteroides abscessus subsp. massiliense]